jgi:hypothetical protein
VPRFLPLAAVPLLAVLMACTEQARPLPTYPLDELDPNAMALMGGVLEFDGSCVFLSSPHTTTPVFFPENGAIWSEDGGAIYFEGVRMEIGKPITLAGAFLRKSHAAVLSECGTDTTWLASRPGPVIH